MPLPSGRQLLPAPPTLSPSPAQLTRSRWRGPGSARHSAAACSVCARQTPPACAREAENMGRMLALPPETQACLLEPVLRWESSQPQHSRVNRPQLSQPACAMSKPQVCNPLPHPPPPHAIVDHAVAIEGAGPVAARGLQPPFHAVGVEHVEVGALAAAVLGHRACSTGGAGQRACRWGMGWLVWLASFSQNSTGGAPHDSLVVTGAMVQRAGQRCPQRMQPAGASPPNM